GRVWCQSRNEAQGRFAPERIKSVASGVRSWSVAGIKGIRIRGAYGPGAEGGTKVREAVDRTEACVSAGLGVLASVRLAAEVDTAPAGAEIGVSRKARSAPGGFVPTPTIWRTSLIPLASCKNHPECVGIRPLRS